MILMIDNFDSFTYNIVQAVRNMEVEVATVRNNAISPDEIAALDPDGIIVSPGPGRPADAGISMEVISRFYRDKPLLGVCLGHQCIAEVFGGTICQAGDVMHGKLSSISHDGCGLFAGIPQDFAAVRYHSLAVADGSLPQELICCAHTADGEIMALRHAEYQLYGLQFHPESIATEFGEKLIENFVDLTRSAL